MYSTNYTRNWSCNNNCIYVWVCSRSWYNHSKLFTIWIMGTFFSDGDLRRKPYNNTTHHIHWFYLKGKRKGGKNESYNGGCCCVGILYIYLHIYTKNERQTTVGTFAKHVLYPLTLYYIKIERASEREKIRHWLRNLIHKNLICIYFKVSRKVNNTHAIC